MRGDHPPCYPGQPADPGHTLTWAQCWPSQVTMTGPLGVSSGQPLKAICSQFKQMKALASNWWGRQRARSTDLSLPTFIEEGPVIGGF